MTAAPVRRDGLQPTSDGRQSNSDGLHTKRKRYEKERKKNMREMCRVKSQSGCVKLGTAKVVRMPRILNCKH